MSSNAGGKWLAKQNSRSVNLSTCEFPDDEDEKTKRAFVVPPATFQISESLTNEERISFLIWSQNLPVFAPPNYAGADGI